MDRAEFFLSLINKQGGEWGREIDERSGKGTPFVLTEREYRVGST